MDVRKLMNVSPCPSDKVSQANLFLQTLRAHQSKQLLLKTFVNAMAQRLPMPNGTSHAQQPFSAPDDLSKIVPRHNLQLQFPFSVESARSTSNFEQNMMLVCSQLGVPSAAPLMQAYHGHGGDQPMFTRTDTTCDPSLLARVLQHYQMQYLENARRSHSQQLSISTLEQHNPHSTDFNNLSSNTTTEGHRSKCDERKQDRRSSATQENCTDAPGGQKPKLWNPIFSCCDGASEKSPSSEPETPKVEPATEKVTNNDYNRTSSSGIPPRNSTERIHPFFSHPNSFTSSSSVQTISPSASAASATPMSHKTPSAALSEAFGSVFGDIPSLKHLNFGEEAEACQEALRIATEAIGDFHEQHCYSLDDDLRSMKQRRSRAQYTPWQIQQLDEAFRANQYPDVQTREALASRLSLIEPRIQVWFQNRRAKTRRQLRVRGKLSRDMVARIPPLSSTPAAGGAQNSACTAEPVDAITTAVLGTRGVSEAAPRGRDREHLFTQDPSANAATLTTSQVSLTNKRGIL